MFTLKNKDNDVLIFSDFKRTNSSFDFYEAKIALDYESFLYSGIIEIEKTDLYELETNLQSVYENKIYSFIFQPINDRLKIEFKLDDFGHIKISVFITSLSFNSSLNVKFESDQSYLKQLINDIKNIKL